MHIAIVGAGALGSVVGGYLARDGHQIVLLGRSAHVQAIRAHGLHVTGLADFVVPVEATDNPADLSHTDLLLLTVKTRDTMATLASVRHVNARMVASLQNGITKDDHLVATFGRDRVIGATTITGATMLGPGVVAHTADGYTFFGELDGAISPRVLQVVDAFAHAGLKVQAVEDVVSAEWSKLCQLCPAALVSALTRLEYHKICKNPDLAALFVTITRESAAVAAACGVQIGDYPGFNVKTIATEPFAKAVQLIMERGDSLERRGMTNIRISMLQDILAGRKTEIEDIAGVLVAKAHEKGVAVPTIEAAYRAIRGIEAYL